MKGAALLPVALVLFVVAPAGASPGGHYLPQRGDGFHYDESITVNGGLGDYAAYSDLTLINGSVGVTAVAANGTESATYANAFVYSNSSGGSQRGGSGGNFTFSAETYLYLVGTDNQTGYTNPAVWFYINSSVPTGGQVELLNTPMVVQSTNFSYEFPTGTSRYVRTVYAEGSGSYQRADSYGVFAATYVWQAYFDPSTGYVVGYDYTEQDRDTSGNGFTYTDLLSVTTTTYTLTPAVGPPTVHSGPQTAPISLLEILAIVVVLLVVVAVGAMVLRPRRRSALPRHSAAGRVEYGTVPAPSRPPAGSGGPPPPIHLTTVSQPAVQQVVLRETVKVNCRYCGTLIDSTETVCPKCGAPRT